MKKVKLITSLCSIGTIAIVVPAMSMSFSMNNEANYDEKNITNELNYSIADLHWRSEYTVSDNDIILSGVNTSSELQILLNGERVSPFPITWKIGGATYRCLKASIDGYKVTICPDNSSTSKPTVLQIEAYDHFGKKLCDRTFNIKISNTNVMIYDGKQYVLSEKIDPNRFLSRTDPACFFWDWNTQHIWLTEEGKYLEIEDSYSSWSKLTALKLVNVDPCITTIDKHFLQDCDNLKYLDLYGLKNIGHIGYSFLKGCTSLESLTLPGRDPWFIYIPRPLLEDVPRSTVIHCKAYLKGYLTAPVWSLKAGQMTK